jgi:hypothetical protein
MIEVIDNFLEEEHFQQLKSVLMAKEGVFPWYYNQTVNTPDDTGLYHYQFVHLFYHEMEPKSDFIKLLVPFLKKLNIRSAIRIKANLLVNTPEHVEHGYHTDVDFPNSKTAIFYLNSNNGYTKFDDGTIVNSVSNRVAIFNSNISHTGSTCTDKQVRIIINFNYF